MKITSLRIPDLKIIEPHVYEDERGYFFESFNQEKFNNSLGTDFKFVQDNQSKSSRGVIRGLHYQKEPFAQGKLVRVLSGEVYDVALDLRRNSQYFSQWQGVYLSDKNNKQLWIPPGFAHGFMTISDEAVLSYKVTEYYNKAQEGVIKYDDEFLSITWPENIQNKTSKKDDLGISFKKFKTL
ncbi:MAG: dTDP-4-dehydrorhamnose 3,5-epimerase [Nitrosomonadales bacterium]|jgi:dTDP-4-dehydrorhamnose 3,5-epimerase|nr:dTDP-4-dehydrorhamnose 3,5-epimerase [Nitrosomonadales bacterium]